MGVTEAIRATPITLDLGASPHNVQYPSGTYLGLRLHGDRRSLERFSVQSEFHADRELIAAYQGIHRQEQGISPPCRLPPSWSKIGRSTDATFAAELSDRVYPWSDRIKTGNYQ